MHGAVNAHDIQNALLSGIGLQSIPMEDIIKTSTFKV